MTDKLLKNTLPNSIGVCGDNSVFTLSDPIACQSEEPFDWEYDKLVEHKRRSHSKWRRETLALIRGGIATGEDKVRVRLLQPQVDELTKVGYTLEDKGGVRDGKPGRLWDILLQ